MARVLLAKFPYSSTYGGGEKHTLTLVQHLSKEYDFFLLSTCSVLVSEFKKRGWSVASTWAGTEPVTPKAVLWFFVTWPAILINLLCKLLTYKLRHHVDAIFCLSLTEKVLVTPFARLFGIKVFWMEHLQIERWLLANPLRFFYILWSRLATVVTVVEAVKDQLDNTLEQWGYHLIDLQLNDITFDEEVMRSMAKIVASNNLKAAAENEGQALLITKTKAAEAEGNAIKISAQAEKDASQLHGQGVALFREEVAKGMAIAAQQMQHANLDANLILFSMWTEAIKNFAEHGKGNVIFLDGSTDGMQRTIKEMMAVNQLNTGAKK